MSRRVIFDDSVAYASEAEPSYERGGVGSGGGGSTTTHGKEESTSGAGGTKAAVEEVHRLAGDDTRNVRVCKLIVVAVIALAGALVSVGINLYLNDQERDDVDDSFDLFVNTIEDVSLLQFRTLFESVRGMSSTITTIAANQNMTFPFVILPNFEVFARQARMNSGIEVIAYAPYVEREDLAAFGQFVQDHADWVEASHRIQAQMSFGDGEKLGTFEPFDIPPSVYDFQVDEETGETKVVPPTGDGPFTPLVQGSPPPRGNYLLMSNALNLQRSPHSQLGAQVAQDTVIGACNLLMQKFVETVMTENVHQAYHSQHPRSGDRSNPHVAIVSPIFDSLDRSSRRHVGDLIGAFDPETFMINLLPRGVNGVFVVVENDCGQVFTYKLNGNRAQFLGEGDFSDPNYHRLRRTIVFDENYEEPEIHYNIADSCVYRFQISPSGEFSDDFSSNLPIIFALVVAVIFFIQAITFLVYDAFVRKRNDKVMSAAVRSTAIVSSLFPSNVRDRLYAGNASSGGKDGAMPGSSKAKLRQFIDNGEGLAKENDSDEVVLKSQPIADLFPETTVMFADIAGFTAWSSVREPSQVFMLLETVYRAFDRIAKRRHVFKVETVGDCYVAVAGCPDPMKNHPVTMSRFAMECMQTMDDLTKRLEVTLGPDTGELKVRIGLHSGPVTAGVLRGERARFQLFGDTMNTAARLESTGKPGRIQLSEETAELLHDAGKSHWLIQRLDTVYAKGKGALKTFWLVDDRDDRESSDTRSSKEEAQNSVANHFAETAPSPMAHKAAMTVDSKTERLINWNVDVLFRLLKQVVARRRTRGLEESVVSSAMEDSVENIAGNVLEEVREIIALPKFDPFAFRNEQDSDSIELHPAVKEELREYVASIASMYRSNPFHNFEHASHVTMSVVKLLSRIVAPTDEIFKKDNVKGSVASSMHDHTYGITSDPLTQFACVLSALIHDADHPGVPNAQLVKEKNQLAAFYNNQSVAEQNSVDLAWNLLMDENFKTLRQAIYGTEDEMKRFRQLVVNSVMATDIVDKELKSLRNARWEKAFSEKASGSEQDAINRKATIVIEHLIQASDVAHTMQHWHIYRKWNERFFMECYKAYKAGRGGDKNPADGWYKGELGFFDFYIIPLAKKLKDCGVFGVSSDEYLNYAQKNRQEWEMRGKEVVASMLDKVENHGDTE